MPASALQDPPLIDLQRLEDGPEVLSVYLSLGLGRGPEKGFRPELIEALREARKGLDGEAAERFDAEARRVQDYVENEFDPQGRTLALFSSRPRDLWVALPLQIELGSEARFGPQAFLRPLEQNPAVERACIVLIDRSQARLLTMRLGSIEMDRVTRSFFPRSVVEDARAHKPIGGQGYPLRGGDATTNEDRSREAWADKHFQDTYDLLEEIDGEQPFARLIVGGTNENTTRFLESLPDVMRPRLAGQISVELEGPVADIIREATDVIRAAEQRDDEELVRQALDGAAAGGRGAAGWEAVLDALQNGRVDEVAVVAGGDETGQACPQGHFVTTRPMQCPVCGSNTETVPSLVDFAETQARATSARFELVEGEAAKLLEPVGGVAARLRY